MDGAHTSNSEAEPSPGLYNKAFDEAFLNASLSEVHEEYKRLLQSPIITKSQTDTSKQQSNTTLQPQQNTQQLQSHHTTCGCTCINKDAERLFLVKVVDHVNALMFDFFRPVSNGAFQIQLEGIVAARLNEMNETASFNTTLDNSRLPRARQSQDAIDNKIDLSNDRFDELKDQYTKVLEKGDSVDSLSEGLTALTQDVKKLSKQLDALQVNTDENVAVDLHNGGKTDPLVNQRLSAMEHQVAINTGDIANGKQYTRREIIEIHNIPYENMNGTEPIYNMIINFLRIHFGLLLTKRDISVCHRQVIPPNKKRLGKQYIAPIYCKFLNRHIIIDILARRKMCLKNVKNIYGQPIEVKHNLTLENRALWNDVHSMLADYKFKYINNWKIFVKKDARSPPIHVTSYKTLKTLSGNEKCSPSGPVKTEGEILTAVSTGNHDHKDAQIPVATSSNNYVSLPNSNNQSYASATSQNVDNHRKSSNRPIFKFNNKSFVNYKSSPY